MSIYRKEMLESEIMKLISSAISEMKDPRLEGKIVSVTRVELSNDRQYADVFVSAYGDEQERRETLDILQHASGFIRSYVAKNLRTRSVPVLRFREDKGIESSIRIHKILEELHKDERDTSGG